MTASRKQKDLRVSSSIKPHNRQPVTSYDPESNRDKMPAWHVRLLDSGFRWSFDRLTFPEFCNEVVAKLKDFETMTWQEILNASGGPSRGNNNHEVSITRLCPAARRRLKELKLDDITALFSLRVTGRKRIWGILDGHILKLIWFDPEHEVCSSIDN